jgi:hypothetical protein
MRLALIEPEPSGQEKFVFECTWCRHGEVIVLGLNRASCVAPNAPRPDILRAGSPRQATGAARIERMREHYRRLSQAPRF